MAELETILQETVVGINLESHDFIGDGLLDSFGLMALIGALEESYNISIFDEEINIEDYANLESICALLRKKGVQI